MTAGRPAAEAILIKTWLRRTSILEQSFLVAGMVGDRSLQVWRECSWHHPDRERSTRRHVSDQSPNSPLQPHLIAIFDCAAHLALLGTWDALEANRVA